MDKQQEERAQGNREKIRSMYEQRQKQKGDKKERDSDIVNMRKKFNRLKGEWETED